jgi:hypothetical protein
MSAPTAAVATSKQVRAGNARSDWASAELRMANSSASVPLPKGITLSAE